MSERQLKRRRGSSVISSGSHCHLLSENFVELPYMTKRTKWLSEVLHDGFGSNTELICDCG